MQLKLAIIGLAWLWSSSLCAQLVTVYIPHQYALQVDTNKWTVPYIVPHPFDYQQKAKCEFYYKAGQAKLHFMVHNISKEDTHHPLLSLENVMRMNHLPWEMNPEFDVIKKELFYAEFSSKNKEMKMVRGYYRIAPDQFVTFHYMPTKAVGTAKAFCKTIEQMLKTMQVVGPKVLDEKAGFPYNQLSDQQKKRAFIRSKQRERLLVRGGLTYFKEANWEYSFRQSLKNETYDTLVFDKQQLNPYLDAFSFQRVADELSSMKSKTVSMESALNDFFHENQIIHDEYRVMVNERARLEIEHQLSQQLSTSIFISPNTWNLLPHAEVYYLHANSTQNSYLVYAHIVENSWQFNPIQISSIPANCVEGLAKSDHTSTLFKTPVNPSFTLLMPKKPREKTLGIGYATQFQSFDHKIMQMPYQTFALQTHSLMSAPCYFDEPNLSEFSITYEIIESQPNYTPQSFTRPFSVFSTVSGKKWQYSRFINWNASKQHPNSKPIDRSVDVEPNKRAYISPVFTSDFNANGYEEVWYVLISNGKLISSSIIEASSTGAQKMKADQTIEQHILNEPQVKEILALSQLQNHDPILTLSRPPESMSFIPEDSWQNGVDMETGPAMPVVEDRQDNEETVYTFVSEMPQYPGKEEQMQADIFKNLTYPESAKLAGIEGKVYVSIVVEKDGSIRDVRTVRGVSGAPELNKAAESAIKKLKPFYPGKQNGKPVRTQLTIPITFKLK